MQFTGKLLVERSGMGARSTVKENEYYCHCYVRTDGLAAVSVTDGEYQVSSCVLFQYAFVKIVFISRITVVVFFECFDYIGLF